MKNWSCFWSKLVVLTIPGFIAMRGGETPHFIESFAKIIHVKNRKTYMAMEGPPWMTGVFPVEKWWFSIDRNLQLSIHRVYWAVNTWIWVWCIFPIWNIWYDVLHMEIFVSFPGECSSILFSKRKNSTPPVVVKLGHPYGSLSLSRSRLGAEVASLRP